MIKDLEFLFKNLFFSEKFLLEKRLKRAIKKNYEKELSIISSFKNSKRDAVDVGVYRGIYTYKLSQEFKHVYSFEPNPLIYPYLKKNLTKIIKNMSLQNLAISDNNGEINLKIPSRRKSIFKTNYEELYKLGCATIHKQNKIQDYDTFKVKKIKLDDILKNKDISFIKIDVEGHEKEVINGSKNIIINNRPALLVEIEERHSNHPVNETIKFINNLGYNSFYVKDNNLYKTNDLIDINSENNFIFLPNN
jgi:FkbM family methyltransferase